MSECDTRLESNLVRMDQVHSDISMNDLAAAVGLSPKYDNMGNIASINNLMHFDPAIVRSSSSQSTLNQTLHENGDLCCQDLQQHLIKEVGDLNML